MSEIWVTYGFLWKFMLLCGVGGLWVLFFEIGVSSDIEWWGSLVFVLGWFGGFGYTFWRRDR